MLSSHIWTAKNNFKNTDRETKRSQWNEKTELRIRKKIKVIESWSSLSLRKPRKAEHLRVHIKSGVSGSKSQEAAKCWGFFVFFLTKERIHSSITLLVCAVTCATCVIEGQWDQKEMSVLTWQCSIYITVCIQVFNYHFSVFTKSLSKKRFQQELEKPTDSTYLNGDQPRIREG